MYVRLCSSYVRAAVFMLCMPASVHGMCVWLCLCCVRPLVFMLHIRALVFMLRARALVFMLRTCGCVHVMYARLCSCYVRVVVFMLCTSPCLHVACSCVCVPGTFI